MSAYTQVDLDNLDRMIVSGVLSTTYDGKRIEYRSMTDLIKARASVAGALAAATGSVASCSLTPTYSKGL